MSLWYRKFYSNVDLDVSIDECLVWTGSCSGNGRPRIWSNKKMHVAARFIYEKLVGKIPTGMFVCHSCDNPKCVRVSHLFVGTPLDNMIDMTRKGREVRPNKISDKQVEKLRALWEQGARNKDLIKIFGISPAQVSRIVHGTRRVKGKK